MIPEKFASADVQVYKCHIQQFKILTLYCYKISIVVFSSCHFLGFPCDMPKKFLCQSIALCCMSLPVCLIPSKVLFQVCNNPIKRVYCVLVVM